MDEWFVCVPGGKAIGPVSTSLLLRGIRSGKVHDEALVCRRGEKTWRGVLEVPELASAMPGTSGFRVAEADTRYAVKNMLGRGGMGEVYLCADEWIGREVAMKIVQSENATHAQHRARFVREALVQGQLEHPSVVPVYDIGTRPDGASFFTMKRVRGLTLAQVVDGLRRDDPAIRSTYSRRRLLTAMSSVCLAVSFAHSRGVVHRDLKPENVMLGDFGEVYVLDWGVARVIEDAWVRKAATQQAEEPVGRTLAGALVGTPGYAAPEQVGAGDRHVTEASDVYALGAILFELLALEPMNRGPTVEALITATLTGGAARPSVRAPQRRIAPELDNICARATAMAPEDRFPSARAMQEAIERYLDGERDAERRLELAKAHADAAAQAFEAAAQSGPEGEAERARALRELGAALALEPSNEGALRTLMRVLLDAPGALPPEAEAELLEVEAKDRTRAARDSMLSYAFTGLGTPLLLFMHVLRPMLLAALVLVVTGTAVYLGWMWRTGNAGPRYMSWSVSFNFLIVGLMGSIFGPLVMVPGVAVVTVATLLVGLRANPQVRLWAPIGALAAILIPTALELAGVFPRSYVFEHGSIRIVSNLVEFSPLPAYLLLLLGSVQTVMATVFTVGRAVDGLVASERRSFAQAWRLRQMFPTAGTPSRRVPEALPAGAP
jgi:serine/threonine-protein kinase